MLSCNIGNYLIQHQGKRYIIITIMVNLSLINNNNVIKSLEMKSNSKHRTSSKYGENRNTKK